MMRNKAQSLISKKQFIIGLIAVLAVGIIITLAIVLTRNSNGFLQDNPRNSNGETACSSSPRGDSTINDDDFIVLSQPEYLPNADDRAVGGDSFLVGASYIWSRLAVATTAQDNLPKVHLDILWQRYLESEQEQISHFNLAMDVYNYNGSDQLQSYWDQDEQPIAEYWMPAFVELELKFLSQKGAGACKTIELSAAISPDQSANDDFDLEQFTSDLAMSYEHKFADATFGKLTVFTYNGSKNIDAYQNEEPVQPIP